MKVITYKLKNDQKEFDLCQKILLDKGFRWRDSGNKMISIYPHLSSINHIFITIENGLLQYNTRNFKEIFPDRVEEETIIEFSSREEKLKRILK